MTRPSRRAAFSMIEVLVVLGLLGLLFALFAPAVAKVRSAAARTQSMNNMKQQAIGCHAFHDVFRKFPFNGTAGTFGDPKTPGSGSWAFQILPFMEQQAAFQRPKDVTEVVFAVYRCPGRARAGLASEGKFKGPQTDYAVNCWLNDTKNGSLSAADAKCTLARVTDGTSNTILIGELALKPQDYAARDAAEGRESFLFGGLAGSGRNAGKHVPDGPDSAPSRFGGPFPGGTLFAMCDGSVRFVAFRKDVNLALRPDDGNPIDLD